MKRRFIAICLMSVMLILLASSARASAPAGVCFTAANDQLLELNTENMPFYSNNVLYVSSRVFEGTELGISYVRSTSLGVVMLYNSNTDLRFDLAGQIAYDKQNNLYNGYAIEQGGVVFFPLNLVCRYFGLTWSYNETDIVPLIRIKNSNVILSDSVFIDAAASLMRDRYSEYERSLSNNINSSGNNNNNNNNNNNSGGTVPVTPPRPAVTEEEEPVQAAEGQRVYLLLSAQESQDAFAAMDALEGVQATFLLTAEQMRDGDLLRAIVARGHSAALWLAGETLEEVSEELADGRERLWQAACSWLELVWYENDAELNELLDAQGYLRIAAQVAPPSSSQSYTNRTASLMRSIGRYREDVGVRLGDAGESRHLLPGLLAELEEGGYLVSAWRLTA